MAFALKTGYLKQRINFTKFYSTMSKLINVSINNKGVAMMTMQSPPVNSLNYEFLAEFNGVLDKLEQEKPKGIILTSFSDKVFSAGLDINEMFKPSEERLRLFWKSLQDAWIKLYGLSIPNVAVINGHSPAGGCLLAMSCDYRVMLNNFTIGLNETNLGIIAPTWFVDTMLNTISTRHTELALTAGKLFSTEEALKIGLIDEVAASKEEAVVKAESYLNQFKNIPPLARISTKKYLRGQAIQALEKNRENDVNRLVAFVTNPKVQQSLEVYLSRLKNKKA